MADLAATSFCAVGRKYGVSDNAIRKWVRWYEAERAQVSASGPGGGTGAAEVEPGAEPDAGRSREAA
jgi:transposase-like protein